MQDLSPFLLACVALIVSPGPATLLVAATSATYGCRAAIKLIIGLLASMALITGLVGAGLAQVVLAHPQLTTVASLLALGYMLYLAYRIATAPTTEPTQRPPAFRTGFLLNFINPKAYAAVGALFAGFTLRPDEPLHDVLTKGLIMLAVVSVGHSSWLMAGRFLATHVRNERARRYTNRGFAALLLLSMAAALLI